jgi:trehalose 6-phosphate synthase/phosphatase
MEPNPHCNGGLKNAVDSVGDRMKKKLWVGTLGTCTDGFGDDLRKDIDTRMLAQRDSLPVWIPDAEFQSCYDEFCHQVGVLLHWIRCRVQSGFCPPAHIFASDSYMR